MMRERSFHMILTTVILCIGTAWLCPVFGDVKPTSDSVAVVNGQSISRIKFEREFQIYMQRLKTQGMPVVPESEPALRMQLLNDLIGMELLYQESQKKGITVSAEQVDNVVADIKKRYADPAAFRKVLERMQMTEDQMRAQIAHQAAIRSFIDQEIASKIHISEEATKGFYDANPQYFQQPEQIHARHILVKVEPGADEKSKVIAKEKILAIK